VFAYTYIETLKVIDNALVVSPSRYTPALTSESDIIVLLGRNACTQCRGADSSYRRSVVCLPVCLLDTAMSFAKVGEPGEPIENPFGLWTWVGRGPRNHVLGGARIPFCGFPQFRCQTVPIWLLMECVVPSVGPYKSAVPLNSSRSVEPFFAQSAGVPNIPIPTMLSATSVEIRCIFSCVHLQCWRCCLINNARLVI